MYMVCEGHPQINWVSAGMRFVQTHPTVLPEPVVQCDTPADGGGAQIYGTVMGDGSQLRMWYAAFPKDWNGRDSASRVACAVSDDGIHWTKPNYGVLEARGSKDNHLTDLPFLCPSIFIDPTAPAAMRYRAFGYYNHPQRGGATYTAYSEDGLRWTVEPDVVYESADGVYSAWDPYQQKALIMLHRSRQVAGMPRRCWFSAWWTRDGKTEPVSAWVPDEYDDAVARSRGYISADYYGVAPMFTPGLTIGFLWPFRHQPPVLSATRYQFGNFGNIELQLTYQLEPGGKWMHFPGRVPWLSVEQMPEWGRGNIYTASTTVDVGDETWLYITGDQHHHGWFMDYNWKRDPNLMTLTEESGFCKIGLAKWPKNRLLGYRASLVDTIELTPRRCAKDEQAGLVLNAVTESSGGTRVALCERKFSGNPIPGFGFDDCIPLSGDLRDVQVRWKNQNTLPSIAKYPAMSAEIEITKGTLFAFDFVR